MCSYVEKYAEFKNQTLKKIGWYTKMLCATEYPGGRQFLKLALKWGYPIPHSLISPTLHPKHWCQIVSWGPMNEKTMFLKNKHIWAMRNCMVTMATINAILTGRGIHTNSIIS